MRNYHVSSNNHVYLNIHDSFMHRHPLHKNSQHGTRNTYRFVPLQRFENNDELNWNETVENLDKQLYIKYNLTEFEELHIENKIKSMQ